MNIFYRTVAIATLFGSGSHTHTVLGAGHPNVDFTNATFSGIEYFSSSHRRQYSVFGGSYPINFLGAGAKRRIRRFPRRQRRLRRRQPPKTAPRQLHNKSRFFAPCLRRRHTGCRVGVLKIYELFGRSVVKDCFKTPKESSSLSYNKLSKKGILKYYSLISILDI